MKTALSKLKRGQIAIIHDTSSNEIPLKLIEMGCIPGSNVKLVEISQLNDPLYLQIEDTFLGIRKETAMQCMSTIAIVKKETNSWKWPIIQFSVMTSFAYVVALITYQIII